MVELLIKICVFFLSSAVGVMIIMIILEIGGDSSTDWFRRVAVNASAIVGTFFGIAALILSLFL